jgi:branched-chain amino acid transport system substrate-binding protein
MSMSITRCSRAAVAAACLALLAAACSSSSSSGSGGGSTSTAAAATATATSSAGTASSSTMTIGLGNMNTGSTSFPAAAQGAQVAADYLNATQGGIAGHKVALNVCDLRNDDQSAQQCGEQFANNPSINAVGVTLTLNGGPFYSALKSTGKPTLLGLAITPVDYNNPNTYSFNTSNTGLTQDLANFAIARHAKTMTLLVTAAASGVETRTQLVADLKGSSVKLTTTYIPVGAANVLPQIVQSGAKSADVVAIFVTSICNQIAAGMSSLGINPKTVVAVSTCITSQQMVSPPAGFNGWYVQSPLKIPQVGKDLDPQITTMLDAWSKYGSGATPGTFAEVGWGTVMNIAAAVKAAGVTDLTSANINKALAAYTGSSVMGAPKVKCPGPSGETSVCGQGAAFYQFTNGKLVPSSS